MVYDNQSLLAVTPYNPTMRWIPLITLFIFLLSTDGGSVANSFVSKACDVCPEMVLIPAGSFRMGDLDGGGDDDEKPVHMVNIKLFALGKTEVTFVVASRESHFPGSVKG